MEFRLLYEGPLKATTSGNSRTKEKHAIRKELHKQLRELWHVQKPLTEIAYTLPEDRSQRPFLKAFSDKYARFGFSFLPLVNKPFNLVCSLDILFLRKESPGELIRHGGDLDNRLKTLFDALRMPHEAKEVAGFQPERSEDPFFCLLEDDALITEFRVSADRLLTPLTAGRENDVFLLIQVKTRLTATEGFYSSDFSML